MEAATQQVSSQHPHIGEPARSQVPQPNLNCLDCGLNFDSSKSLDVHLNYHKENLMSKWGTAASGSENNNNVKKEPRPPAPDSSDFQFYEYSNSENSAFQRIQRSTSFRFQPYAFTERVSSTQVQCDKCGFVCDAGLMVEHEAQAHPSFTYEYRDDEPQSEILDLDSQKVVYQPQGEENHWLDRRYFKEENGNQSPDFASVSTTLSSPSGSEAHYFEPPQVMHLSSSQIPKFPMMSPKGSGGGAWKSNEARRPKTYNCSACNKWFTSSGHLKRHYNTTLHKNAVKQSGMMDPASLPMSSQHQQPPSQQQVSPLTEEKFFVAEPQPQMQPLSPHHMQQVHQLHQLQQLQHQQAHIQDEFQEYYGYPNGLPPHALNFNEPLPSFAQFASSLGGFSVGGLHQPLVENEMAEVSSSVVTPPPAPEPTSTQVHKCIDCDKTFNKACYLTQHNKSFHSGDKPYKCVRCGKRFMEEQEHMEHLSKHAGEKPFKCEMCPKQFNHKTDLRRHMCLHSGDKPYSCNFCGKGFIRKDHMLKHAETHKKKALSSGFKKMDVEPRIHLRAI